MPPPLQYRITRHAVLRYIERVAPTADLREANAVLLDVADRLEKVDRTYKGQVMWKPTHPRDPVMWLVTKHDPQVGMILVTVLGPDEDPYRPPPEPPSRIQTGRGAG